jgi:hypothetical protein
MKSVIELMMKIYVLLLKDGICSVFMECMLEYNNNNNNNNNNKETKMPHISYGEENNPIITIEIELFVTCYKKFADS